MRLVMHLIHHLLIGPFHLGQKFTSPSLVPLFNTFYDMTLALYLDLAFLPSLNNGVRQTCSCFRIYLGERVSSDLFRLHDFNQQLFDTNILNVRLPPIPRSGTNIPVM